MSYAIISKVLGARLPNHTGELAKKLRSYLPKREARTAEEEPEIESIQTTEAPIFVKVDLKTAQAWPSGDIRALCAVSALDHRPLITFHRSWQVVPTGAADWVPRRTATSRGTDGDETAGVLVIRDGRLPDIHVDHQGQLWHRRRDGSFEVIGLLQCARYSARFCGV